MIPDKATPPPVVKKPLPEISTTEDGNSSPLLGSFEERAEALLSRVFGGMHHVYNLKKEARYWTCIHSGDCSTFDGDTLTRLVFAAHDYCIRVQLSNGGPRALQIMLHPRNGRTGSMYERHPTIEQSLERWKF